MYSTYPNNEMDAVTSDSTTVSPIATGNGFLGECCWIQSPVGEVFLVLVGSSV